MRQFAAAALLLAGLAACTSDGGSVSSAGGSASAVPGATATLLDASGAARGSATFTEAGSGIRMQVTANGLTPGAHGIHVHAVGACTAPDFTSAGSHWNPTGKMHGMENPAGPHAGDLQNITIGADGTGTLDATLTGTLAGLMDADGAALVIHASPDDYKTDPSGNSGGRIACGVVTKG